MIDLQKQEDREELRRILIDVVGKAPEHEDILSTEELMKKLGIKSKATINKYHHMGLPFIKGRPNRYRPADVRDFLTKHSISYASAI